jgi:two-component system CheB/CheR fusion protein
VEQPANSAARRGSRILVAEDYKDSAESMARLLGLFGHEVLVVYDGPQTISAALSWGPEFILLDLGLPTLDGFDVATKLRQEPSCRDTIIIAVTGYGRQEDLQRCRAVGIDWHVLKPVAADALESLIASYCRRRATGGEQAASPSSGDDGHCAEENA